MTSQSIDRRHFLRRALGAGGAWASVPSVPSRDAVRPPRRPGLRTASRTSSALGLAGDDDGPACLRRGRPEGDRRRLRGAGTGRGGDEPLPAGKPALPAQPRGHPRPPAPLPRRGPHRRGRASRADAAGHSTSPCSRSGSSTPGRTRRAASPTPRTSRGSGGRWTRGELEVGPRRIALRGEGMAVTLNGIAQGFAADRAAAVLREPRDRARPGRRRRDPSPGHEGGRRALERRASSTRGSRTRTPRSSGSTGGPSPRPATTRRASAPTTAITTSSTRGPASRPGRSPACRSWPPPRWRPTPSRRPCSSSGRRGACADRERRRAPTPSSS